MAATALLCALSLLLGLHIGATWPWLAFLARHPSRVQETTMTTPSTAPPVAPPSRRAIVSLTVLLIVTMVGTFALGVLLVIQRAQLAETTRDAAQASRDAVEYQQCQADYTTDFREAYQARADASIASTVALDDVLEAVRDALQSGDPTAFAGAVQAYLDVRREQTRKRSANPLPPLPEQVCGPAPTED